jgi:hypothetical protein
MPQDTKLALRNFREHPECELRFIGFLGSSNYSDYLVFPLSFPAICSTSMLSEPRRFVAV